jgi:RNA polymerase sigma-70 factor (ECF subfamily)
MTDDATRTFDQLRPRLQGIGYRMLGSIADAEELVQDAWLRWHAADVATLDNAEAWLVTVTTRLAIDRLRRAKAERAHYAGFWLPEPRLDPDQRPPAPSSASSDEAPATPEQLLERADVFDADYAELARALDKSEAACRQIVSRAKAQLKSGRPRQPVSSETHHRLLAGFAEAARSGDLAALQSLLAQDAQLVGDGGGVVTSFGKPLVGAARIARLYLAGWRRSERGDADQRIEVARINGQWGLLRFVDGRLESAQALETDGSRIVRIHVQRNPHKLRRLAADWAAFVTKRPAGPSW